MTDVPMSPPPAQPAQPNPDQRNWAMGAHLSAFVAAWVLLAFIGPLVVWLVKREEDPFVAHHAREALNFQLTWLVGGFVAGAIGFVVAVLTLGLGLLVLAPLALLAGVLWIVFTIRGALAGSRGEDYRYPLTVRLVS